MIAGMFAIISFSLMMYAIERDINYGLPDYEYKRSFGLINWIYVLVRIVAPWVIAVGILSLHWRLVFIWIGLYIFANLLKIIAWKLAYWKIYKLNFKL